MVKYLPLFPLNIVVFPGEKLNLHIFEPRYKQLVLDCMTNEKNFGIPTFIDNKVGEFGTEVKILQHEKSHANGEMDIRTQGVSVFKLKQFDKQAPGRLYAGGEVKEIKTESGEDIVIKTKIKEGFQKLHEVLGLRTLFMALPDDFKSYDIAHHIGMSVEQEYQLLQVQNESDRQELILEHLKTVVPIIEETERLKERVKLNGHFKNLTPPSF